MSDYDYDTKDVVLNEVIGARTNLIYSLPYIGEIALMLDIVILDGSNWCTTAAVDGVRIYLNRNFVQSLYHDAQKDPTTRQNGRKRLKALLAHEVLHVILEHIVRRGNRDKKTWGMAIDFMVNAIIVASKIGLLPDGALVDKRFHTDMTAEEVYEYLRRTKAEERTTLDEHIEPEQKAGDQRTPQQGEQSKLAEAVLSDKPENEGGVGSITVEDGNERPAAPSPSEIAERAAQVRASLIQAFNSDPGSMPGAIQREVEKLVNPKMNWRGLINTSLRSIQQEDYTYDVLSDITWASWFFHRRRWTPKSKYAKNFCAIIPELADGPKLNAMMVFDASASMSADMIRDLMSEFKGVAETFPDFEITLATFDTHIYNVQTFTPANVHEFDEYRTKRVKGGGGTNPSCISRYLVDERMTPDRLIVFTDGEIAEGNWGDPRLVETLWIIHNKKKQNIKPPYGSLAYYE